MELLKNVKREKTDAGHMITDWAELEQRVDTMTGDHPDIHHLFLGLEKDERLVGSLM